MPCRSPETPAVGSLQTATQIAEWAEDKAKPADTPAYSRLSDTDKVLIVKLHDDGLTQVEIAQRLHRSQSTISDVLAVFSDTTVTAKRYLAAKALRMAENIVENGQPRDHVATLKGLKVLAEDSSSIKLAIGLSLPGLGSVGESLSE
jgi:hypothetical protein